MPKKRGNVTIAEIAADAGVSLATVSRVINRKDGIRGSTSSRVIASMNRLGYSLPEELKNSSSGNGLILFNIPSLNNPFYEEIIMGAKSSAARYGYHLLINKEHINRNTIQGIIDLVRRTRAAGIITANQVPTGVLQKLSRCTTVVQCCEFNQSVDLPYVTIDDASAAEDVIDYLFSAGKRRIALINGPEPYKYARCRLIGYESAFKKAGVPIDQGLMVQLPSLSYDLAVSACMQLLNSGNPPDSFFTCSDIYAAAAVRASHLSGYRVPQDIMVTGFDNVQLSAMVIPSITTVNQPKVQLGAMACELLMEKIADPESPNRKVVLKTELIIRESTLSV